MSSVASRAVRKMIGTSARAEASRARDLEAVDVGQHHVEHEQLRRPGRDRGDRIGAGRG